MLGLVPQTADKISEEIAKGTAKYPFEKVRLRRSSPSHAKAAC